MAAGDWGEGTAIRVKTIVSVPDRAGDIDHSEVSYDVVLPSGEVVPRVWTWAPPPTGAGLTEDSTFQDAIHAASRQLVDDVCSFEGCPLFVPPPEE
jgi:hypothetical protein